MMDNLYLTRNVLQLSTLDLKNYLKWSPLAFNWRLKKPIYFAKKLYSKYASPSQNFGTVWKLLSKVTTLIHNIFFESASIGLYNMKLF